MADGLIKEARCPEATRGGRASTSEIRRLIAVHAPLITGPVPLVGSVAGALLTLVGGGWIALSAVRGIPGREERGRSARIAIGWRPALVPDLLNA